MINSSEVSIRGWEHSVYSYGAYASVKQVNETLKIHDRLSGIPAEGNVLNIGAGSYLAINALIRKVRPDVSVISLDGGYTMEPPDDDKWMTDEDEKYIATLPPAAQYKNSTAQYASVAAIAEAMPFSAESFDFVFGHASVPENMYDQDENFKAALANISHVTKLGSQVILGPHLADEQSVWADALRLSLDNKLFSSGEIKETEVYIPEFDTTISAYSTELVR